MAQVYTVTESTSVVLVNTLLAPYTLVYLSTSIYPGHIVGIRDTTGSPNIHTEPILISTTSGIHFYDGTHSTLINQPNGYLTIASQNSTTWQVLNNVGFFTSLSNAYLESLTGTNVFTNLVSSIKQDVTSMSTTRLVVTNSLALEGTTSIQGGLTFDSSLTILSTLTINGDMNISSSLFVYNDASFPSTVIGNNGLQVIGNVSTLSSITTGGNVAVGQALYVINTLVPKNLSVQTITMDSMNLAGGLQVLGNTNVGANILMTGDLTVDASGSIQNSLIVNGLTTIQDNLDVAGNMFGLTLNVANNAYIANNITVVGGVSFLNNVDVSGSVQLHGSTFVQYNSHIGGNSYINGPINLSSATVKGNAYFSSIAAQVNFDVGGDVFATSDSIIQGTYINYSDVTVNGSLYAQQGTTTILSTLYDSENMTVNGDLITTSTLYLTGTTLVQNNMDSISTASITGTVSTAFMNVVGEIDISGQLNIGGVLTTDTFGAPISFSITNLTLSNTLYANVGSVPLLSAYNYPTKMLVGVTQPFDASGVQDLWVEQELQVNNTITQIDTVPAPTKDYSITQLTTSTVIASYLSGSEILGDSTTYIQPVHGNYLTFNMPTFFNTFVSTNYMSANTVNASSISGYQLGDGSGLTNITNFTSSILISTLSAIDIYTTDISANIINTDFAFVETDVLIKKNTFLSSAIIFVAAGNTPTINKNIQLSYDAANWLPAANATFEFSANGVTGNGVATNSLFVSVGSDSRTSYTVQWSQDANNWYPALSGGYSNGIAGIKKGNAVAYESNINTWTTVGRNSASNYSTIQYSHDGKNWRSGSNVFKYEGTNIRSGPNGFIAVGIDTTPNVNNILLYGGDANILKYSGDGISWSNSYFNVFKNTSILTFAYGVFTLPYPPQTVFNGWLACDTFGRSNLLSIDNGLNWNYIPRDYIPWSTQPTAFVDIYWNGSLWLGVGGNSIDYSPDGYTWFPVITTFPTNISFKSITYNSNKNMWVAGAAAPGPLETLWSSPDGSNWSETQTGGFTSALLASGAGYGIVSGSNQSFIAVGTGSLTGESLLVPQILNIYYDSSLANWTTSTSLDTVGLFQTTVRGIAYTSSEEYNYVAVGNGATPQRTIGRSLTEGGPWRPAISGGFSPAGYGVVSYNGVWIAVGDAQNPSRTIQYSTDGANWFPTNYLGVLSQGGRGITLGDVSGSVAALLAVGLDPVIKNTIANSSNGFDWVPCVTGGFGVQGNGITAGMNGIRNFYIATGQDIDPLKTVQYSFNGLTWSPILSGGFSLGGYGVAYQNVEGQDTYIVVGSVDTTYQVPTQYTIQYSYDGSNYLPTTNAFSKAGYSVTYNAFSNLWFATGEEVSATSGTTIKYSGDGILWSNIDPVSGFQSQQSFGIAASLYSQEIKENEIYPYIETPGLAIYERKTERPYPKPTMRLTQSNMFLNEAIQIDLSSNIIVGGNSIIENAKFTVYGDIYTSSFIYLGDFSNQERFIVSTLSVSSLVGTDRLLTTNIQTPSLFIGPENLSKTKSFANTISFFETYTSPFPLPLGNTAPSNAAININNVLYATLSNQTQPTLSNIQTIGIGISTPAYALDISGSIGTSSFIGKTIESTQPITVSSLIYFQGQNFTMFQGPDPLLVSQGNTIYTEPSSITLNSIVNVNISSQKVGVYTKDPQYDLDVPSQSILFTASTSVLYTGAFFLTLQTI